MGKVVGFIWPNRDGVRRRDGASTAKLRLLRTLRDVVQAGGSLNGSAKCWREEEARNARCINMRLAAVGAAAAICVVAVAALRPLHDAPRPPPQVAMTIK